MSSRILRPLLRAGFIPKSEVNFSHGKYGAFTVSVSQIEKVKEYVLNQEKHHGTKTFQDEYVELLKLNGIEYDEKYLW